MNSREIKFRIWNGMEMVYDITVGRFGIFYVNPERGDGLNPKDTASLSVNTTKYQDSIPLMQFTGLKDKNGKEIYDGDLHSNGDNTLSQVVWDENFARFAWVIMDEDGEIVCGSIDEIQGDEDGICDCEIIGNIYQNPELLK